MRNLESRGREQTSKQPDRGRREALRRIALSTGAATAFPILRQGAAAETERAGQAHAAAAPQAGASWTPRVFDALQNDTVIALSELIIPETDTPGAKTALVNRYIDLVLDEDNASMKKTFLEGLAWIDERSRRLYGKPFVGLDAAQRTALLTPLANPENSNPEDKAGLAFFQQVKDLTIFAYYTSKVGMEQELQYGGDDYHTEYPGACTHPEHQT